MVQTTVTRIQLAALWLAGLFGVAFCLYISELIVRTRFGSTPEFIGVDVIIYSLLAGTVAAVLPIVAFWHSRFHRRVLLGVAVAILPLLAWFIWAVTTGVISDKSNCVKHVGLLRCLF